MTVTAPSVAAPVNLIEKSERQGGAFANRFHSRHDDGRQRAPNQLRVGLRLALPFLAAAPAGFFEGYIAEQNMVGMSMGLAARGAIPFAVRSRVS